MDNTLEHSLDDTSDDTLDNTLDDTTRLPVPGDTWSWRQIHGGDGDRRRNLPFLCLPWEEYGVTATFSSRVGGCGTDPYAELNLGLHVGDDPEVVLENRHRFLTASSCSPQHCVAGEQIHGVEIADVDDSCGGAGMLDLASVLPGYDALTTRTGVGLMAFFADCVPLYFFDPKTRRVALAHAGWRGSAAGMARSMVAFLSARGCRPSDLLAAIGPCVGSCCYEVDASTVAVFKERLPGSITGDKQFFHRRDRGKYALDLQEINRLELLSAGLTQSHISCASLCTCCNSDWFFSYRKNPRTGRMAAFIRQVL